MSYLFPCDEFTRYIHTVSDKKQMTDKASSAYQWGKGWAIYKKYGCSLGYLEEGVKRGREDKEA